MKSVDPSDNGLGLRRATVGETTPQWPRKSEGDVIELHDGRLLLCYMEFGANGSDGAPTRLVSQKSVDQGRTWNGHQVLAETNPGDINVYSPNLIRGQDGSILLFFMRQHRLKPRVTTQHIWKSTDEGDTFTAYGEVAKEQGYNLCNAVVKRMQCGRLLLPVAISTTHDHGAPPSYEGTVLYSDDDGLNWRDDGSRVSLPMRGVMEPHVEETRDGRVLMVMRNQLGSLYISESVDVGVSWSKPQTTGLRSPEACAELRRIPATGDLLMIWNNSLYDPMFRTHYGKRSPLTAAVSRDEGRSWSHIRDLEDEPGRAYSNPGCEFTASGTAIIHYWTCQYNPDWSLQGRIDLRVTIASSDWFYGN